MPQSYRGKPRSASRFLLPDRRAAVLVPREPRHFAKLQNGYPLAEEYLDYLASEGVAVIAVDDGARLHLFDLRQYRTGNRVGHAPYPMKRVADLNDARLTLDGELREREIRAAEWEWLTEDDVRPPRDRTGRPDQSSRSPPREAQDSVIAD